jgi:uncharacterized surface protein with fasciclin (FAS1) repeats
MKKALLTVIAIIAIGLSSNKLFAQTAAPAAPTGDLIATLSGNSDYNVLAVAIRAANLGAALKGAGPYTIFAPSNTAFSNLSSGKLDSLLADPAKLATLLKGHVVEGKYDKAAILKALATPPATLKTLDGQTLTLGVSDKHLQITDAQGNKANFIAFDMLATNGVAIGLNAVLTK